MMGILNFRMTNSDLTLSRLAKTHLAYVMIMCAPHEFICWRPNPQHDGIWSLWEIIRVKWSREGGVSMTSLVSSLGEEERPTLTLSPLYEDAARRWPSIGRGPLLGTKLAGTLTLDFSVSRTMRTICSLLKPPHLWYFAIASQATIVYI